MPISSWVSYSALRLVILSNLNSKQRSRALRACVKQELFPAIEALRFTRLNHTGYFYGFGRVKGDEFHLIEIQWDKYHRPKFTVNFGRTELETSNGKVGVRNPFTKEWQALDDVGAGSLPTYYRLSQRGSQWFKYRWVSSLFAKEGDRATVRRCADMLDSVEGWFDEDPESIRLVDRMNGRGT
jgi:hypothetical protein